jgi:hypothetical protein
MIIGRHEVFVDRADGSLYVDGKHIGYVTRAERPAPAGARWRAERGDPRKPEETRWSVVYARTRGEAIEGVLD